MLSLDTLLVLARLDRPALHPIVAEYVAEALKTQNQGYVTDWQRERFCSLDEELRNSFR